MKHGFQAFFAFASFTLLAGAVGAADKRHPEKLPSPRLAFLGTEKYEANGFDFVRYQYDVTNKGKFSKELFTSSPDFPACGENAKPSRASVDIYDTAGKRLTEFCSLPAPDYLGRLWFAVAEGASAPAGVYVEITDRLTGTKTRSNVAPVPKPH